MVEIENMRRLVPSFKPSGSNRNGELASEHARDGGLRDVLGGRIPSKAFRVRSVLLVLVSVFQGTN